MNIMKQTMNFIAYGLIALGIMAMAGSAGDCDGKCVENANTIAEMLIIAGTGLAMMLFGAMILLTNKGEA
jgi:hypothetical protein